MVSLKDLEKYYQDGLLLKQTHPRHDLTIWNYSSRVQYERLWDDVTHSVVDWSQIQKEI
jgi:hypothetical protein